MAAGKLARYLIRILRPGGGSALPGTIARIIDPKLLERVIGSARLGLVVISGSAGKSTTTKALVAILEERGLKVFTNPSTANILQGYFAAILQFADLRGRISADVVVLEWDEGHGAAMSESLRPRIAVITNLLSDQLDRFVDPDIVLEKLKKISDASGTLIANSDDPNLAGLISGHPDAFSFGLSEDLSIRQDRPIYALNFNQSPKISAEAIVVESDVITRIKLNDVFITFDTQTKGLHQALNQAAAVLAASKLTKLDAGAVEVTLSNMPVVFARDEVTLIRDRKVRLMLVQNFTSFQLNLDSLRSHPSPLMLMAGSDIHDPSWLWVVDFSKLVRVDIVGGFNAQELALRLRVAGVQVGEIINDSARASEAFLVLSGDSPTIIFSADAMRRTRRHLGLAK